MVERSNPKGGLHVRLIEYQAQPGSHPPEPDRTKDKESEHRPGNRPDEDIEDDVDDPREHEQT